MTAGIVDLLKSDSTVNGLISGRVYLGDIPQDAQYPCLVILVASQRGEYDLEGRRITSRTIQMEGRGQNYYDADSVRDAVLRFLDAYQGTLTDGTRVLGTFIGPAMDFFESSSYTNRAVFEFTFQYVEP